MSVRILFGPGISERVSELLFCIIIYYRDLFTYHSIYLDQMLRFAASDLGLNCWSMSLLWDTRHKWVNSIPERGHNWIIKYSIL